MSIGFGAAGRKLDDELAGLQGDLFQGGTIDRCNLSRIPNRQFVTESSGTCNFHRHACGRSGPHFGEHPKSLTAEAESGKRRIEIYSKIIAHMDTQRASAGGHSKAHLGVLIGFCDTQPIRHAISVEFHGMHARYLSANRTGRATVD